MTHTSILTSISLSTSNTPSPKDLSSAPLQQSIHILKVQILPIRQIIKRVHELRIIRLLNARRGQLVLLLILPYQMVAQEDYHYN